MTVLTILPNRTLLADLYPTGYTYVQLVGWLLSSSIYGAVRFQLIDKLLSWFQMTILWYVQGYMKHLEL